MENNINTEVKIDEVCTIATEDNLYKLQQAQMLMPKADKWAGWKKRVCIAIPTIGTVRVEWMMARFGQIIPCNWSNGDIFQFYSQYSPLGFAVAEARNICVEYFISQGFEWLLQIDEDVILTPDVFLKFNEYMRHGEYPIICGLYFCKGSTPEPLVFRGRGTSFYTDWKAGDKIWVDGLPTGLSLMHRSVVKAIYDVSPVITLPTQYGPVVCRQVYETPRKAWFDPETQSYQSQVGTEDLFFLDRIKNEKAFERCGVEAYKKYQDMEFPFLVDTGIFAQHIDANGVQYPANVGIRTLADVDKYLERQKPKYKMLEKENRK